MDLDDKIILKVHLVDEIRKMPIHNNEITYDELLIMLERVFKIKLKREEEIIIKYKDEDDDLILITDDSDLEFAIQSDRILKLVLSIQNKEYEPKNKDENINPHEVQIICRELQFVRDKINKLIDNLSYLNTDDHYSSKMPSNPKESVYGDVGRSGSDGKCVEVTGPFVSVASKFHHEDNIQKTKSIPSNQSASESQRVFSTMTSLYNIPTSRPSMVSTITQPPILPESTMVQHNYLPSPITSYNVRPPNITGATTDPKILPHPSTTGQLMPPSMTMSSIVDPRAILSTAGAQTKQGRPNQGDKGSLGLQGRSNMPPMGSQYILSTTAQIYNPKNTPYRYPLDK